MTEPVLSTLYRGDTRLITLNVKDGNGDPVDISQDTITLTIAPYRQAAPVITKTNGGGDHENPLGGVSIFVIEPADSAAATVRKHHVDISRVAGDSSVTTLFMGTIQIENKAAVVA
jgi:hypothetical protein